MNKRNHDHENLRLLCVALLLSIGITTCQSYPPSYLYRVLAYQDSDFADINVFPANAIARSSRPATWTTAYSSEAIDRINELTSAGSLQGFIQDTQTSAFLVVRNGTLLVEGYGLGHTADSMQNSFSISKSVMSAVAGIAVRDGLFNLDSPITEFIPELLQRDARFADIEVGEVLGMRSGISYSSSTGFPFFNRDDALIYYHPDLQYVILNRLAIEQAPGEFEYNNYNPPLLGILLRRTSRQNVAGLVERELWEPLGAASDAGWTVDNAGMERMESGFFATARDLVKFGQLYLDGGRVRETQLLPSDWIEQTTGLLQPVSVTDYNGRTWSYGLGWWIIPRPQGRPDFSAIGRYGQFLYVSPQHNVVILRTGPGRGDWGDGDWTELFYALAGEL